jgi:hypothetical protein
VSHDSCCEDADIECQDKGFMIELLEF